MKTIDEAKEIAKACHELDVETHWWCDWTDGDELKCLVNCNDLFAWGFSDAEEVEAEDLPLLKQAAEALKAIPPPEGKKYHCYDAYAAMLFVCMKRKCRPQGAYYDEFPAPTWPLFDACGPVREVGFGNPKKHPSERPKEPA